MTNKEIFTIAEAYRLEQFSNFENVIRIAWFVGWLSIFLTFVLFLTISTVRLFFEYRQKRVAKFQARWEPLILESLEKIPEHLPDIDGKDELTFVLLWNHFQELLNDESKENLILLGHCVDLPAFSRRMLEKSNLKKKLLAINTLGWLKDKNSWDSLVELLNHKRAVVSLSAARALVLINPKKSIPIILPLISKRTDWSLERCAELLRIIGTDVIADALVEEIYWTPPYLLPRMIRFLDLLLPERTNFVVKNLIMNFDDKEVLYACLLVFRDFDELKIVREFLNHESWEVRMQAAVCLGKTGYQQDIEKLVAATHDKEWWVRYRSAQALTKIPSLTVENLKQIADRNPDSFSHDVILRATTEREVAESCGLSF